MVKATGMRTGVFPGRFNPFTNAHLDRLIKICEMYPTMRVFVLVGDVGCVNRENFLMAEERCEMINIVIHNRDIANVFVKTVKGAYPPDRWVKNVLEAVPDADTVFSDNPFIYGPLQTAGLTSIVHQREGIDGSVLRDLPFAHWKSLIPPEIFIYIETHKLYHRLLTLPSSSRYPFMSEDAVVE